MSLGCDFGWGWFAKEGCDGSTSDVPQPFELATPGFPISAARLTRIVTIHDAHFLLTFFPF